MCYKNNFDLIQWLRLDDTEIFSLVQNLTTFSQYYKIFCQNYKQANRHMGKSIILLAIGNDKTINNNAAILICIKKILYLLLTVDRAVAG